MRIVSVSHLPEHQTSSSLTHTLSAKSLSLTLSAKSISFDQTPSDNNGNNGGSNGGSNIGSNDGNGDGGNGSGGDGRLKSVTMSTSSSKASIEIDLHGSPCDRKHWNTGEVNNDGSKFIFDQVKSCLLLSTLCCLYCCYTVLSVLLFSLSLAPCTLSSFTISCLFRFISPVFLCVFFFIYPVSLSIDFDATVCLPSPSHHPCSPHINLHLSIIKGYSSRHCRATLMFNACGSNTARNSDCASSDTSTFNAARFKVGTII